MARGAIALKPVALGVCVGIVRNLAIWPEIVSLEIRKGTICQEEPSETIPSQLELQLRSATPRFKQWARSQLNPDHLRLPGRVFRRAAYK